ncbi:uncharacterized protein LOC120092864 [Benincasa hispida]|uniref:uncharacterized protein LOC120092864 n=1 Tax=Benincasa hispida TaxID=102211 RepID=UPI0019015682|nr:uncharacterized protein LOC120092864 [Benincasa hispida]XP_038907026.1 uncharacterized protein LOC120092864 [Benincasa hispida]XP_038907027.1 uncharacterized protein LOC120092864 [Benincasa hispida]XP_038907028.1 uncharacterized protein LOC120092864 [Benincasa hispida]XP_038907030.1 uncharacterized protein LOC120092864 [Benincasa hispida]
MRGEKGRILHLSNGPVTEFMRSGDPFIVSLVRKREKRFFKDLSSNVRALLPLSFTNHDRLCQAATHHHHSSRPSWHCSFRLSPSADSHRRSSTPHVSVCLRCRFAFCKPLPPPFTAKNYHILSNLAFGIKILKILGCCSSRKRPISGRKLLKFGWPIDLSFGICFGPSHNFDSPEVMIFFRISPEFCVSFGIHQRFVGTSHLW